MKKVILTIVMCFLCTSFGFSQIKMVLSGDVSIGPNYGSTPAKTLDVLGLSFISHVPPVKTPGYSYSGVYFDIYLNGTSNEDPVMLPQWNNTYFIGTPTTQMWSVYSNKIYANGVLLTSDARYKTNLIPLESSLSRVLKLNPYSFDYKFVYDEKVSERINKRAEEAGKNQVGFKAQDLLVDFPNLVEYNEDVDKYSVNYIGFIPELVAAFKEQNQIIEEQKQIIEELKSDIEMVKGNCCTSISSQNVDGSNTINIKFGIDKEQSRLQQNNPNPFNHETVIDYFLSANSTIAVLYLYNMNGKQLEKFELSGKGHQSITIKKNKLQAGMYFYSLIVNGEEVATKKMILTD